MEIKAHRELKVWQKSLDLVDLVYALTKTFPKDEQYALSQQLRRCAVSVPSNIAEGNARNSTKEYLQFISIARGSLAELDTQLIIAFRAKYINQNKLNELESMIAEIGRMLAGMKKSLTS